MNSYYYSAGYRSLRWSALAWLFWLSSSQGNEMQELHEDLALMQHNLNAAKIAMRKERRRVNRMFAEVEASLADMAERLAKHNENRDCGEVANTSYTVEANVERASLRLPDDIERTIRSLFFHVNYYDNGRHVVITRQNIRAEYWPSNGTLVIVRDGRYSSTQKRVSLQQLPTILARA